MKNPDSPACRLGSGSSRPSRCSGLTLSGLVFTLVGIAIFALPFLRPPDAPSWLGEDLRRAEVDIPFDEDLGYWEEDFEADLATPLSEASEEWFGLESEALRASGLLAFERIEPGRVAYQLQCAGCHGDAGDGAGPAARHLMPRPRNFRKGVYKFTSTGSGSKPLRRDLFQTITRGLSGASMPDFRLLPEEERHDLVEYVRYLSMRGEFEQLSLDEAWSEEELPDFEELAEIIYERWDEERLRAVYPDVEEPDRDEASVERGRELFLDTNLTQCDSCHGAGGRGDGINADAYEDDWGYALRPRDFTQGVFRAGASPEDLWRSIATGINGTPMGAFDGNLTGEQIWDLVHFVQAIAAGEAH